MDWGSVFCPSPSSIVVVTAECARAEVQGPVVRRPVNANQRLHVTQSDRGSSNVG